MARVPNKIKLIDGSRETLKLFVRIPDLWFIGIPEKSEQAKKNRTSVKNQAYSQTEKKKLPPQPRETKVNNL